MPPACDELTSDFTFPLRFKKHQTFGPQSRARLSKTFGSRPDDGIVRNDEVVGSIPTSSTITSVSVPYSKNDSAILLKSRIREPSHRTAAAAGGCVLGDFAPITV